jgi:hypothetical protein
MPTCCSASFCQGATEWDDCSDLSPSERNTMEEWKAKFLSKYYVRYELHLWWSRQIYNAPTLGVCPAVFLLLVLGPRPLVTTPMPIFFFSTSGRLVKDKDAADKPPLPEWNIA